MTIQIICFEFNFFSNSDHDERTLLMLKGKVVNTDNSDNLL